MEPISQLVRPIAEVPRCSRCELPLLEGGRCAHCESIGADMRRARIELDRALVDFAQGKERIVGLVNRAFFAGVRHGRSAAAADLDAWQRRVNGCPGEPMEPDDARDLAELLQCLRAEILRPVEG